ncbi:uncharacterized protein LOC124690561 [Lolium rigidum]|uniref:uncharacterized protein LOC124690561 n=1 Tax=Lolium rigidum TaxID=89674 RepID=UPI001F5D6953|nr:uncharacterized protein LOC124690561 [Lolium rigidum]
MSRSSTCAAEAGLVAMDCVVVCCCCPCLVLQITVFLFVRLPRKVVVKSKRIILRRWHKRRSSAAAKRSRSRSVSSSGMRSLQELLDGTFRNFNGGECSDSASYGGDSWKERCFAMDDESSGDWKERCFAVDDDDDGDAVWEALVQQEGLFWFGSFWGRTEQGDPVSAEDKMYAGLSLPVVLERVCDD